MSSGGGKGGKKETVTKTEIPQWVREPAERNLARAEDVQDIGFMPWYGPSMAAFNPTQNAAFQNNISAGEAFGLLGANHGITPEGNMPTAQTFDGGWQGYSAMPLYDQALAEMKSKQPIDAARYNQLYS